MPIGGKTIKLLWANAAGRCAFPGCNLKLCTTESGAAAPYTIGEMAHIHGDQSGANRHKASQTQRERDSYDNLILLCPTHHTEIDKPENEANYPAEMLHEYKNRHEALVSRRLELKFSTKRETACYIEPLLAENHAAFMQYGPRSEIAHQYPQSEAHGVWLSERLTTILPNNRRITEILGSHRELFHDAEQHTIAAFILHARSYERWVRGETSYEGVPRFPQAFEKLVTELCGGSE